jgi:RNA recognition motif-containing protein
VRLDEGDPQLRFPPTVTSLSPDRPPVGIHTAKIMRERLADLDKGGKGARVALEADGVTPRSKGFGFVEFSHHMHALAALRMLNNNPAFSHHAAGGAAVSGQAGRGGGGGGGGGGGPPPGGPPPPPPPPTGGGAGGGGGGGAV